MRCLICTNLELAFEARRDEYVQAHTLAYYAVSKRFAAYRNVEMERALIDLEEHRSTCRFATSAVAGFAATGQPAQQQDAVRSGIAAAAA